jgi:hypothetical protein
VANAGGFLYGHEFSGGVQGTGTRAGLDGSPDTLSVCTTQIEDFVSGRRRELQSSARDDGTLRMVKVVTDGQDRTAEALRHGGSDVQVEPMPFPLQHPFRSGFRLGWQPLGRFGVWLRQVAP